MANVDQCVTSYSIMQLRCLQACASTPYPDLYYGGMMAAYGPQPLVGNSIFSYLEIFIFW